MECKENIIGLSDYKCDCFDIGKPTDYNESLSGMFITDVVNINNINDLSDCSSGSLWDLLSKSREQGFRLFKLNYNKIFKQHLTKNIKDCKNALAGDTKLLGTVNNTTNSWIGVEIDSNNVNGTFLNIRSIDTYFSSTSSFDLYIYSNYSSTPLHTVTLNTTGTGKTSNAVNIELPLYLSGCEDLKYYFIYQTDLTNLPKDNRCTCGCQGKQCFKKFYKVQGVEYSSFPTDFELIDRKLISCNGIKLVMDATCKEFHPICPIDLETEIGQITATIINNESALVLVNRMLNGNSFSFDTEKLLRQAKYIKGFLNSLYEDLVFEIKDNNFGCISCKENGGNRLL